MRRVRRSTESARIEIMPLIDVIFLLLTFFIFALVLMVRADVLDVRVPQVAAGEPAEPGPLVTIALSADGELFVNGEEATRENVIEKVRAERERLAAEDREPRLFVAADEDASSGELIRLLDLLAGSGLAEFSVVGRPMDQGSVPAARPPDDAPQ